MNNDVWIKDKVGLHNPQMAQQQKQLQRCWEEDDKQQGDKLTLISLT